MKTQINKLLVLPALLTAAVWLGPQPANAQAAPAPSGIVAWWPAEGNADDIVGTNNGVLVGGATFSSGKVGQAFCLDGTSGYVAVPASSNLNVGLAAGLTIEGWIAPTTTTGEQPIVEWNNGSDHGVHFWISLPIYGGGPGSLFANVFDTAGANRMFSSATGLIVANTFQHVAVTYDKNSGLATLYVNGVPVAQQNLGVFTPQTSYNVYLGYRPSQGGFFFGGLLDEISIYNRALSASEIAAIYTAGSAGKINLLITGQPQSQLGHWGKSATFSVTAKGGNLPLSYQWFVGSAPIFNATNAMLVLNNLQATNAGAYTVKVSDAVGNSVTSTPPAVLTMTSVFTTDATINIGDMTYDGQDIVVSNCTLTVNGPHSFTSLLVTSNGVITHAADPAGTIGNRLDLTILTDATVALGGAIQASGLGYGAQQGPGAGQWGGPGSYDNYGGGGGYGGLGGGSSGYGAGGTNYGSILQPTDFGSGGGWGNYGDGGAGGGAIQMTVGGTLTVNGQIQANGSPGSGHGGGGSGGSIWLTVGTLSGTGGISASGGPSVSAYGGGGGGGRIAIYQTNNFFAGTLSAWGGTGGQNGGAGTIYTKAASLNTGDLLVDNGGTNGAMTLLTSPVAFNLIITNGAVVYSAAPVLFNNLTVAAGGTVTHLPALLGVQITCLGNLTIQAGGVIQASGLGYGGSQGPGAGQWGGIGSYDLYGGGGGYGGLGGESSEYGVSSVYNGAGGISYGSILQPTDFGSGGGWGNYGGGGAGGGAIQMTVGGTLTVNGQIQANGSPGSGHGGGGSGGSIWLTVGTLSGTGGISASGGPSVSAYGGGGGGGRIAIYGTISSVQTPVVTVSGVTGGQTGSYYTSTTYVAPVVIAQYLSGPVNRFVSYVDVTFNQPVDPGTFTTNDLVLTAPSGPIPLSQITLTSGGGVTWRIGFPTQMANGAYSFTVGPHIANLFGQEMTASYSGGFTVNFTTPTTTVSQTGGNMLLIWSSATGLSYQLQSATNLPAASWLNEGAPLNGTGGLLTNSLPIGAEPSKFFRFLILEN